MSTQTTNELLQKIIDKLPATQPGEYTGNKNKSFGEFLSSSGLQQGLGMVGSMTGGLSGNDLDPTVKNTREGIRSAISAIPVYGPIIAAATGIADAVGEATGLNLDQLNKESAKRAGVNSTFNDIVNAIPGLSWQVGAFNKVFGGGETIGAKKSAAVDELASSYGGTSADINAAMDLGGKNILGGTKKANSFIAKQNIRNDMISNIDDQAKNRQKSIFSNAQNIQSQNQTMYMGGRQNMAVGKRGMKLPSVYEIRQLLEIKKFADGGKMNVIVEGAYHSRKNHLSDINPELEDITPKGIPVITRDEGGEIVQTAEVEQKEMILHLELTEKLEALWKDGSEEAMIEAGKLLAEEIINNTDDKTGEVLDNE